MKFTRYKIVQYPDGQYAVRRYPFFGLFWDGCEYGSSDNYWWSGGSRSRWARYDSLEKARAAMMRCGAYDNQVKEIE